MIRIFSQYVSAKGMLLFFLQTVLIGSALVCGVRLRFWWNPAEFDAYVYSPNFPWQALAIIVVFQICFYHGNLYAPLALQKWSEQLLCLGQSLGMGCLLLGIMYFAVPSLLVGRGIFLISTVLTIAFVAAIRAALNGAWDIAGLEHHTLIVGTGTLAGEVAAELRTRSDLSAPIAGFVTAPGEGRLEAPTDEHRVLGSTSDLQDIVRARNISRIIVAVEDRRGRLPVRQLLRLRGEGVQVEDAHTTLAALTGRVRIDTIQPSWFVFSDGFRRSTLTMTTKRIGDVVLASIGLVLSLPLMALAAIAIWIDSGSPILYRQTRVGLRGKHFKLLKFRSMAQDAETQGAQWAVSNDPRVTRVGRFFRRYRLDEMPQFINIIRGEMSFVGPRPERPVFVQQLREASIYFDERHLVRPGLTGWAQVQYVYGSSVEEAVRKLEYDLFYLKNMSVFFDLLIVAKTLRIVLTGHGAR
jgi:sugar transferase (PEP-CTERM system associated)